MRRRNGGSDLSRISITTASLELSNRRFYFPFPNWDSGQRIYARIEVPLRYTPGTSEKKFYKIKLFHPENAEKKIFKTVRSNNVSDPAVPQFTKFITYSEQ